MSYQSEGQLEKQQDERVKVSNNQDLMENFRKQFSLFNAKKIQNVPLSEAEWKRIDVKILGKGVYRSAKILRDEILIERDDGSNLYLSLISDEKNKNIYQIINQGFKSFICKEGYDYEYLYYSLVALKSAFIKKSAGSTFLELLKVSTDNIKAIFPSLPEQQQIGSYLSNLDKDIYREEQALICWEEVKRGLMVEVMG